MRNKPGVNEDEPPQAAAYGVGNRGEKCGYEASGELFAIRKAMPRSIRERGDYHGARRHKARAPTSESAGQNRDATADEQRQSQKCPSLPASISASPIVSPIRAIRRTFCPLVVGQTTTTSVTSPIASPISPRKGTGVPGLSAAASRHAGTQSDPEDGTPMSSIVRRQRCTSVLFECRRKLAHIGTKGMKATRTKSNPESSTFIGPWIGWSKVHPVGKCDARGEVHCGRNRQQNSAAIGRRPPSIFGNAVKNPSSLARERGPGASCTPRRH
jgi:hypothetical protein